MKRNFLIIGLIVLVMSGCDILEDKPLAPLGVWASSLTSTSVYIGWTPVNNAESYDVYYETDGVAMQYVENTAETSYTHTYLTPETTYTYMIRAKNSNGVSGYSFSANATTLAASAPIGNSLDNAIPLTAEGVEGRLIPVASTEKWYTFTRNGQGTLSVQDSGNSNGAYTADIVIDIYDSSESIVTIGSGKAEALNMGYNNRNSITEENWSGTYYVKVYAYNSNSLIGGGTFSLSFE